MWLSKSVNLSQNFVQSLHYFGYSTSDLLFFKQFFVVSAKSKIQSRPYIGIFSSFGYRSEIKRLIWLHIRKQHGPFLCGNLTSAHTDGNSITELSSRLCSLQLLASRVSPIIGPLSGATNGVPVNSFYLSRKGNLSRCDNLVFSQRCLYIALDLTVTQL
jgi:hypothetical protein